MFCQTASVMSTAGIEAGKESLPFGEDGGHPCACDLARGPGIWGHPGGQLHVCQLAAAALHDVSAAGGPAGEGSAGHRN